ncbi:MAG TPA: 30S ribosome-binding factor RbfA [Polyangiaceae bacterium LLY-WYZ-14_1]|nr:30S ribosome-binding factor RbfA [Polyangiaceae bacterium LLY-WYZ-14_1]
MSGPPAGGGGGRRLARVASQVQEQVASLLLRGELRGEAAQQVLVSRVEMSPDLSLARVYVRLLDPSAGGGRRRAALRDLDRGKAFLRREVGKRLGLRRTPELAFFWDEGVDHALRVDALLAEIQAEGEGEEDGPDRSAPGGPGVASGGGDPAADGPRPSNAEETGRDAGSSPGRSS